MFAMVYNIYTATDGTLDALGGTTMRVHHPPVIARNRNARSDFVLGHNGTRRHTSGREIVTRDIQLDAIYAFANAETRELGYFHRPIGDDGETIAELVCFALVAQAAGDGDFRPTGTQTGTGQIASIDSVSIRNFADAAL